MSDLYVLTPEEIEQAVEQARAVLQEHLSPEQRLEEAKALIGEAEKVEARRREAEIKANDEKRRANIAERQRLMAEHAERRQAEIPEAVRADEIRRTENLRRIKANRVIEEPQPDGSTKYRQPVGVVDGPRVGVGGGTQDRWAPQPGESDAAYRRRLKSARRDGSLAKRPITG
jgi:hypothetical protein